MADTNARWLAGRAGSGLIVLIVVTLLVFAATQALPADVAQTILGRGATPAQVETLREQLGLDRALPVQYVDWLVALFTQGGGLSMSQHTVVASWVAPRLVASVTLVLCGLIPAVLVSIPLGLALARRRDSLADRAYMSATIVVNSLPEFVLGTLLIVLLATGALQLFPPVSLFDVQRGPLSSPAALALPALTIFLLGVAYFSRLMRASTIDQLRSEYLRTAELRGARPAALLWREALPNAAQPMIQAVAVMFGTMLAGSVALETVFNYPGLGAGLILALNARDLPLIQFIVVLIAAIFVIANLLADLVTAVITPSARRADK
ncbi:MAG: ABC transporter permease [Leucobacter sp.]